MGVGQSRSYFNKHLGLHRWFPAYLFASAILLADLSFLRSRAHFNCDFMTKDWLKSGRGFSAGIGFCSAILTFPALT